MPRVGPIWLLAAAVALCACSGKKKKAGDSAETGKGDSDKSDDAKVEQLPQKPLGVESPRAFNYKYGKGSRAYKAIKDKGKGDSADWKAVIEGGKVVLQKDANHLAAHFLLGIAYANTDAPHAAADHLSAALAGDWAQWGPTLAEDGRLAKFFETDKGKAVLALNESYKAKFAEQAAAGLVVVARRSGFKKPTKEGKQYAASRAELYSYGLDSERYLRLTHTADSVLGFVESPSKDRLAYVSATRAKIDPNGDDTFVNARVGVLDAESFLAIGERAKLSSEAVELMLFYAEGEELQLQTVEPDNLYSVDWEGGKLSESSGKQFADFETLYEMGQADREQPLLFVTMDMARVLSPWGAVSKPVNDLIVTKYTIKSTRQTISLPKNAGVKVRRVTLSPNGLSTTFVGIGNSCDGKIDSALYVADTKTGSAKLVHRGKGLHTVRWIDDKRFAFEAEPTELRVYDADEGRSVSKIKNRAGIALAAISNTVRSEHCPQPATPAVEGIDEGIDETQPGPEEGIEDGEVEEGEFDEGEFED